ncbi:unnamed protein product [Leptosia nina]|uniref:UMA domain-containing protein n=1 Tax=Leptosia nina TaxID=320188 RepID=A0AAV1JPK4_9NEOP
MFTALFGKRRSSPVEDETPAIPGPRAEDGFVVVDPLASGGLYPNVSGPTYPQRQAPPVPLRKHNTSDITFHYLEGVPFSLSKDLHMSANKDAFASEIGDFLAFLTNKINFDSCNYDFSVEKSVLKEY